MLTFVLIVIAGLLALLCFVLWNLTEILTKIHQELSDLRRNLEPLAEESRDRQHEKKIADDEIDGRFPSPQPTKPDPHRPTSEVGWFTSETSFPLHVAEMGLSAFKYQGTEAKLIPHPVEPGQFFIANGIDIKRVDDSKQKP